MKRRLLTIGHSYVVSLNRRLAHELARVGGDAWEVTAVAPALFRGDYGPIHTEPRADEPCPLEIVPAYSTDRVHFFFYGSRLRDLLRSAFDIVHCWEEPYVVAGAQIAR
jgi:phosphatidyl-myo-inositol dimannoside synthase